MNMHAIAKTLNARKLAKPIAVAMTALFIVSMMSALSWSQYKQHQQLLLAHPRSTFWIQTENPFTSRYG
jgi:hypothetical protein